MFIGLHDSEFERMPHKTFPNYALMKLSTYHKQNGNTVELWNALNNNLYDEVYSSKVFDFTPENLYLPIDTIKGGTGYNIKLKLADEIDSCYPDYSLYPKCDYAIGFITRGCINNCDFCVVPEKEGYIYSYRKWQELIRNDSKKLVLMDNNILSCDYGISQLEELTQTDLFIDLNQGMDIMLLNDDVCKILKNIKWLKYIRFSCDKEYQLPYFEKMVELFKKYNIPLSKVFIYVLVRKNIDEAENRIKSLHNMCKSFNLYAQAEINCKKGVMPNKLQLEFAQRYVYGRLYKKETWIEYCTKRNIEMR